MQGILGGSYCTFMCSCMCNVHTQCRINNENGYKCTQLCAYATARKSCHRSSTQSSPPETEKSRPTTAFCFSANGQAVIQPKASENHSYDGRLHSPNVIRSATAHNRQIERADKASWMSSIIWLNYSRSVHVYEKQKSDNDYAFRRIVVGMKTKEIRMSRSRYLFIKFETVVPKHINRATTTYFHKQYEARCNADNKNGTTNYEHRRFFQTTSTFNALVFVRKLIVTRSYPLRFYQTLSCKTNNCVLSSQYDWTHYTNITLLCISLSYLQIPSNFAPRRILSCQSSIELHRFCDKRMLRNESDKAKHFHITNLVRIIIRYSWIVATTLINLVLHLAIAFDGDIGAPTTDNE